MGARGFGTSNCLRYPTYSGLSYILCAGYLFLVVVQHANLVLSRAAKYWVVPEPGLWAVVATGIGVLRIGNMSGYAYDIPAEFADQHLKPLEGDFPLSLLEKLLSMRTHGFIRCESSIFRPRTGIVFTGENPGYNLYEYRPPGVVKRDTRSLDNTSCV